VVVAVGMTTCKEAIKNFESNKTRNPDGLKADEAKNVKLYFMIPPIAKMDGAALCSLKICEHLAMSTNQIDKICNLSGMENLKVLSLGRNAIKRLDNLDAIGGKLEQLWLSYNNITSLKGIEGLKVCHTVYMGNNKVSEEKEFDKLCELPCLEELVFFGNPIHRNMVEKEGELAWPLFVKEKLPNLRKLDGITMVEWNSKLNAGNKDELREVFDKIDTDQSGTLDMKEMKNALQDEEIQKFLKLTAQKVEKAFADIDADGSGDITWEEFRNHFEV